MSDQQDDDELKQMRQQIEDAQEKEIARAAAVDLQQSTDTPQPDAVKPAPEAQAQATLDAPKPSEPASSAPALTPPPATQSESDDPMEWAKKKGLTSPEAIARSLQHMEQEFHKRNQRGHPGYQDIPIQNGNPQPAPVPPPNWQPIPQPMPSYGYAPNYAYAPPPPPNPGSVADHYRIPQEDFERIMPLVMDAAEVVATRRLMPFQQQFAEFQRTTARNNELLSLMQDPAFSDARVQREIHEVLKDGNLFQKERQPYSVAFQMAMDRLARKQLQQGISAEPVPSTNSKPPVTAGGGNGSMAAFSGGPVTEREFNTWSEADQRAYLASEGKVRPKR